MAILGLVLLLPVQPVSAQTRFADGGLDILQGTTFGNQATLFPTNGLTKLLILALNPIEITESAAEQIGLIIQKNLNNTGHFSVVGPRETDAYYEDVRPELVDCREIACGVESGRLLGAQKVMVATLFRMGRLIWESI